MLKININILAIPNYPDLLAFQKSESSPTKIPGYGRIWVRHQIFFA